jgi:cell fate (sporulation/competence/biofilm development) regulator YmcA (YheA/YmcA/DUF963 family)
MDKKIWQTLNETIYNLLEEEEFLASSNITNSTGKKIFQELIKVQALRKLRILQRLKYLKQVIIESLLVDFGVDPKNPSEVRAYLKFLRVIWITYFSVAFLIGFINFLYNLNKTLNSPTFTDSEYSRSDIKRKMKNLKKNLKETETVHTIQRGGAVLSNSDPFLSQAFLLIHFLRFTNLLKLQLDKKSFEKVATNKANNLKVVKRNPRIRPLLFFLSLTIKNRMGYLDNIKEPILPVCSIAPIQRLYYLDLEQTYPIKLSDQNKFKIEAGTNRFIFQPHQKLMTLGEFEFRRGVDNNGNLPISKARNLSRIYHLKRNQVGTVEKLKKKTSSSSTIFLDQEKSAEVSPKIQILTQPLNPN